MINLEFIINTLSLGSLYAMLALGLVIRATLMPTAARWATRTARHGCHPRGDDHPATEDDGGTPGGPES